MKKSFFFVLLQIVMDSSRFIICRASAGSGKTYTLVRQYLRLALSASEKQLAQRFTRILAITFTNKAANEMKERIIRELDNISSLGSSCPMGSDLSDELQLDDATLRRYAFTVRQAILHNYSDFAVCTIDSFMHQIVRTFAHDLGLPLNFDVYIDNQNLIQSAVDELMALVGTEGHEELTEMLCEFAENRMSDGKSYMIEGELSELAEELFKERTPEFLQTLQHTDTARFREIQRDMASQNRAYERSVRNLGKEAMEIISAAGLGVEDFYYNTSGAGAFFRKMSDGQTSEPGSRALAYLEGEKLGGSKCSRQTQEALAAVKPSLQEVYHRFRQLSDTEGVLYNTRRLLLKNIYSIALMNKLGELVGVYARENDIVHISEFNKRISEVVQNEPAPFIYERLGTRYWNYLIDEFQDTSRMQWQNLVPLVENGVASGHTSLVVGDGKQAIYRFRQGDVGQFVSLPKVDNPLHGRVLEHPGIGVVDRLDKNYRTSRTIVEFNNQFFEWAVRNRFGDNTELHDIYIGSGNQPDLAQEPVHEEGYVQIGFWDTDNGGDLLWAEMLHDINHLLHDLGYNYRDITILSRDNLTLAAISSYLTQQGVPVVSGESFLLTQSRVVMLLRSLLLYLLDEKDRVSAARVLIYLKELGVVKRDFSTDFLERHDYDLPHLLGLEGLTLDCDKLRGLGLYDCCEEALRILHLDGMETAYTATFLNVVSRYTDSHNYNLAEFVDWFDEQKERLSTSTSTDLDAVRLMTIHKAKGLESPIILYPILNKRNQQDSIWVHIDTSTGIQLPASLVRPSKEEHTLFDNEYNEELGKSDMDRVNVLYVALTRPREKLMVYCQPPKKEGGTDYTSLLHDYLDSRTDTFQPRPGVWALGCDTPKAARPRQEGGDAAPLPVTVTQLCFPDWSHRIAIADQSSMLFDEFDETHIRRGNQLHDLLSHLRHYHEADSVLSSYLERHPVEPDDATALTQTLHTMMSQPEVARFFNPAHPCKNECSLVWNGEVLRPDRIVYSPDEIWVVDFKSGMPRPEHRDQVAQYCQAVSAIADTPKVKGYLLYIRPERCEVVTCD